MKTLIIYASKHGTAEECAGMLSKKLEGGADLYNLKSGVTHDLGKYEKVIIGGSIYAGRIQKEVNAFCVQNLENLKNKKLGLFICCMFKNNTELQMKTAFPQELLNAAIAKDSFGATMKFSEMSFFERTLTKMVSKTIAKNDTGVPVMDMKTDVSMICEESIEKFAQLMNNA